MYDYAALKIATEPASEPVSTAEAKSHLRVDSSDHDTYIGTLITVAREMVEEISGRSLITQTWDLILDEFPAVTTIRLPRPPLQSVTSITYTDIDDNADTVSSGDYIVDTYSEPGRIELKDDASWPGDTLMEAAGVVIRYVAGYGDSSSDVPARYRQAILLLVGHFHEHPEAVSEARALQELPLGVESLLWLDRVKAF